MNKIIGVFITLFPFFADGQSGFYQSSFVRLNETDFKVSSYFNNTMGNCYDLQYRFESERNDTLFLELIFEARGGAEALNW